MYQICLEKQIHILRDCSEKEITAKLYSESPVNIYNHTYWSAMLLALIIVLCSVISRHVISA